MADVVQGQTVKQLQLAAMKRTFEMFAGNHGQLLPLDEDSQRIKLTCKIRDEYAVCHHLAAPTAGARPGVLPVSAAAVPGGLPASIRAAAAAAEAEAEVPAGVESRTATARLIDSIPVKDRRATAAKTGRGATAAGGGTLIPYAMGSAPGASAGPTSQRAIMEVIRDKGHSSAAVSRRLGSKWPRPEWHAPWRLYRVISGHLGWVRSVAFDPGNEWFATGSSDRTIKLWDLASGQLKITLTGHIEQVTGLAVSPRHPYMFSAGLDKQVKCWDLEHNKVIRNYHGHLSGVYALALHPTLDLVLTGGRDSTCRVWDMRTKVQVFALSGHTNTVAAILSQSTDPQVITGSHDTTIRLWDLRKGATQATLTYHKKARGSVRALAAHPGESTFVSAGADNIKKFKLPAGEFLHNTLSQQRAIVNTLAVNDDGVLVSGGDDGSLWFWDYVSGHCYQQVEPVLQPGSLESEAGVYACSYDITGTRLITCNADKTIGCYKPVEDATPANAPGLPFKPPSSIRRF